MLTNTFDPKNVLMETYVSQKQGVLRISALVKVLDRALAGPPLARSFAQPLDYPAVVSFGHLKSICSPRVQE